MSGPRLALVVPGRDLGGGVPRVAEFIHQVAKSAGFIVAVFNLAVAWNSPLGSRITSPSGWRRKQFVHERGSLEFDCGCRWSELEFSRYLQTTQLRRKLDEFDVIQVVAGSPAWAMATRDVNRPVALQVATRVAWERGPWGKLESGWSRRLTGLAMTRIVDQLDRKGIRDPQVVLVENQAMSNWAREVRGSDAGVVLQPPGVDIEKFRPRSGGWRADLPLICVGRFGDPRKGLERLLDWYEELVRYWPEVPPLVLVGSGDVPAPVANRLASDILRSRVHVQQNVSDLKLAEVLRSSSLFVATPYEEGLGLAAIEAMASGLPVVVTETAGSCQYVVHGQTGFEIEQRGDGIKAAFADRIVETLRDGKGFTMSGKARELAEMRFDQRLVGDVFREHLITLAEQ